MANNHFRGILLWFNPQKGFGMIRPDDIFQDDVLCPASAMQGDIKNYLGGTPVNYYIEQQLIGIVAISVWVAEGNL